MISKMAKALCSIRMEVCMKVIDYEKACFWQGRQVVRHY